jgi:hypothetical protein
MARIRPVDRAHIPGVTRLHRSVFRPSVVPTPADCDAYERYLTGVFLTSPVSDPALPSLVFEDDAGDVRGFVGVAARTVVSGGRRLRAAVSTQFVVDPAVAPGLAAVRLAKAFFEGPQDLSVADSANDLGRGIWERLGGKTARLLSLHWTRPLRPARLAVSLLQNRRALAPVATVLSPLATIADFAATTMASSQFRQTPPELIAAEIDVAGMLEHEATFCRTAALRVEHDEPALSWLLGRAVKSNGRLQNTVVRRGQQLLGWAIWHLEHHGTAEVLQLAATDASIEDVLKLLFYDTWKAGAVAVAGRLDPQFAQALSDKYCLFHRRGPWTLVHSKCPELLQPFWNGNASFARLDGEWPLAFSA